jgi:hypothetical protein
MAAAWSVVPVSQGVRRECHRARASERAAEKTVPRADHMHTLQPLFASHTFHAMTVGHIKIHLNLAIAQMCIALNAAASLKTHRVTAVTLAVLERKQTET